ncbi:MAG: alpha/beta fold hydrolase [Anaerolineae bacterium]|nr:alpha/beta fold hydrolase [Anaerolineae bacterium]MDW8170943.1 alpha/beta fold hydrolase [Anaerolineae bacterium]
MTFSLAAAFQAEEHRSFTWRADHDAAVMLIHGFPGTPAEMRPLAEALHAQSWTTVAPLLPGFGAEIDTLQHRSHDDWLQFLLLAYAEMRRRHRVIALIGLSMGGALALQLAAHHSPNALVLLAPFWRIEHLLWRAMPILKYLIPTFKPFRLFKLDFNDAAVRQGIANFMPELNLGDPSTQRAILDFALPMRLIDQLRQVGQRGYSAISRVSCPTLVIQGTHDDLVKPEVTRHLCRRFVKPPLYLEVDASHTLLDPSQPSRAQIVSAISEFLSPFHPSGVIAHD